MTTADIAKESFQFKRLWRELHNLELSSDKILYRKGDENNQVILPSRLKPLVFKELHVDMGHVGYDQTLELLKEHFFWPKMYDDVTHFVTRICKCIKGKSPNTLPQAPLKTITSSSPMELIGLDFLHLDKCTGGFQYLLVSVRHNRSYGNKNEVAYSDVETESSTEHEALEFTPKELQVWTRVKLKETTEMKGLGHKKMWTLQLGKQ